MQVTTHTDRPILSLGQAADYLGIKEVTLRVWNRRATGPGYFKAGKLVRYRLQDIDDWINSKLIESGGKH